MMVDGGLKKLGVSFQGVPGRVEAQPKHGVRENKGTRTGQQEPLAKAFGNNPKSIAMCPEVRICKRGISTTRQTSCGSYGPQTTKLIWPLSYIVSPVDPR